MVRRKKEEGRRQKAEGRRQKAEGRRKYITFLLNYYEVQPFSSQIPLNPRRGDLGGSFMYLSRPRNVIINPYFLFRVLLFHS
jgi:hypothetical protein